MTYLIDSAWVASFLRGRPEARTLFQALAPDGMAISPITYGEEYDGIYYGQHPAQNERIFRQFLRGVTVLPLNRQIMERFARIRGDPQRRGQIIGDSSVARTTRTSSPGSGHPLCRTLAQTSVCPTNGRF